MQSVVDIELVRKGAGGAKKLSDRLTEQGHSITPQAISLWTRVPADKARAVSEITGVPLSKLRPDLWPEDAA